MKIHFELLKLGVQVTHSDVHMEHVSMETQNVMEDKIAGTIPMKSVVVIMYLIAIAGKCNFLFT